MTCTNTELLSSQERWNLLNALTNLQSLLLYFYLRLEAEVASFLNLD